MPSENDNYYEGTPDEDIYDEDFYFVSVALTNDQAAQLLQFSTKLTIENVNSLGYDKKTSKDVINAIWCVKDGLLRAARNNE